MTASRTDSTVALGAVAVDTGGSGWGGPGVGAKVTPCRPAGAGGAVGAPPFRGGPRPVRVEPVVGALDARGPPPGRRHRPEPVKRLGEGLRVRDRKSTRLNSSHIPL